MRSDSKYSANTHFYEPPKGSHHPPILLSEILPALRAVLLTGHPAIVTFKGCY